MKICVYRAEWFDGASWSWMTAKVMAYSIYEAEQHLRSTSDFYCSEPPRTEPGANSFTIVWERDVEIPMVVSMKEDSY